MVFALRLIIEKSHQTLEGQARRNSLRNNLVEGNNRCCLAATTSDCIKQVSRSGVPDLPVPHLHSLPSVTFLQPPVSQHRATPDPVQQQCRNRVKKTFHC